MLETLFYLVGTPAWAVGGAFTAKAAIAKAEAHYLELAEEAWRKDSQNRPQDKMDADDWVGAIMFAGLAFAATPLIAAWIGIKKLTKPFHRPAKKFFTPPIQKQFDEHVEQMNNQKQLILETAKTFKEVMSWEPGDEVKTQMLEELNRQVNEQLRDLKKMIDPNRASGFDGDYLERAKMEIKALTQGGK